MYCATHRTSQKAIGNRLRPRSTAQIYCIPHSIGADHHRSSEDLLLRIYCHENGFGT